MKRKSIPAASVVLLALTVFFAAKSFSAQESKEITDNGAQLFQAHCLTCHGGTVSKAPQISLLQIMSASSVLRAMDSGVMQEQSNKLSAVQKQQVAEFLTGQKLSDVTELALPAMCSAADKTFDRTALPKSEGWGVDLGNKRNFGSAQTQLTIDDMPELKLKWAFAYPDAVRARSQPAIAGGSVFVGSQNGSVYALNAESGCLRWQFSTVAEVRTGIVVAPWQSDQRPMLFFGDLVGNVYALDASTGELLWRDRPDPHPSLTLTAAPAYYDGRLYVPLSALEVTAAADPLYACCTFRGGVAVYDTLSGEKLWIGRTIDEPAKVVGQNSAGTDRIAPSGAPIWNTPALDIKRKVMYVGTGTNYSSPANDTSDAILALSMEDGHIVWQQQVTTGDAWNMGCETKEKVNCPPENGPDYDIGAAIIIATNKHGRDILIAGQKSGDVYGIDPDKDGAKLWHQKLGRGGIQGGVHFGMAVNGDTLYVPMSDFDGGPRWPGIARPGMFALDISTGKQKWYTPAQDVCEGREFCQPGLSAASSALPGGVLAGAMDGHIRAYKVGDGKVVWDFDTATLFDTLSGTQANGGSLGGGSGPVFNGDMLYLNSGYGIYFHMPGNVLLAFERDREGTK
ncbi:MAG: polyvinyl alcohol dehydrogenase (cytochrome) [Halioglobus sp.]|jgi:polyvinyl alcohol dehydrogenase (cytochrome)